MVYRPASSLSTLTHVHQATSAPVVQEGDLTLRNRPVVTPRPPARPAGRYSREHTEELRHSLRKNNSEPPAPSGARRTLCCNFTPKSDKAATRKTMGLDSRRVAEAGRSQKGTLQAQPAKGWCSQTGTLQDHIPNTTSDGLATDFLPSFLEYSIDKVVLFWQTPSHFFAVVSFVVCRGRRISVLARSSK